ncbi:phage portal protein [Escherichia coli]|uniref:phage portal protein n=1 Tax=Escherichia coli TaxID=562 RepID=UPI001F0E257D|nr:phage portal protein [Escherichia coli]
MWKTLFRKKAKTRPQAVSNRGWRNLMSFIREPYPGAWQQGMEIRTETALAYHAIFACVSLIAGDIAKMRPRIMHRDSSGVLSERCQGKAAALCRRPNAFQNRMQFFEHWVTSKLCHGNTVVLKIRDEQGGISELRILEWSRVTPMVADDGSVFYQIAPDRMAGLGDTVTVPAREVIHDRFNCFFHPLIGLSPVYAAGPAAVNGQSILENSAHFFRNGGRPGGIIEVPGHVSAADAQEIKKLWEENYSGKNTGRTAVLGDSASYKPVSVSAVDSQTVEQLKMTAEIVCSAFHVPAYKAGIASPPSSDNTEALEQQYYAQCLQILIESIELLLDETFEFSGGDTTEFDTGALLRMDSERRMKTLGDGVKNTILTPNEARKRENLPPLPGGDALYLQQQNFSLEALARRDASDDPFSKTPPETSGSVAANKGLTVKEQRMIKSALNGMLKGIPKNE